MPVSVQKPPDLASVRPSIPTDCVEIARNLRESDLAEIIAGGHHDPLLCLMDCYERTEKPMTGTWDGVPICIFGVSRIRHRFFDDQGKWCPRGMGAPWLLGTDGIGMARWAFLKHSRGWLEEISSDYDLLWNRVHSRNSVHIRWLKWLGFHFGGESVYPSGEVFLDFSKVIDHVHH